MTEVELFGNLSTSEYTLWCYIRFWRVQISGSETGLPSVESVANGMGVSIRTVYRLFDSLKNKWNLI